MASALTPVARASAGAVCATPSVAAKATAPRPARRLRFIEVTPCATPRPLTMVSVRGSEPERSRQPFADIGRRGYHRRGGPTVAKRAVPRKLKEGPNGFRAVSRAAGRAVAQDPDLRSHDRLADRGSRGDQLVRAANGGREGFRGPRDYGKRAEGG